MNLIEGAIAAFHDKTSIIVNRGIRNNVTWGHFAVIRQGAKIIALLYLQTLEEKFSYYTTMWVAKDCPTLCRGDSVSLITIPLHLQDVLQKAVIAKHKEKPNDVLLARFIR